MKKLLKVLLPPFVGFAIYFVAIRYSHVYFKLRISEMGGGNLLSFMAFYRFLLPLLFAVAVLTQLLIIVPVWYRVKPKHAVGKFIAAFDLVCVCLVFALGISYAIWDPKDSFYHFVKLFGFMTAVQMVYWIINLFILYLLSLLFKKRPKSQPQE